MKEAGKKALTLKTLNKSNVWDLQENDIFRLLEAGEKDADLSDNIKHYLDIIRSAFEIEEVKIDRPEVISKYEARGLKVGSVKLDEKNRLKFGIKKKTIMRVTDLTYENIRHISASKLLEVIERNFGGGWESLSQSIQDIIQNGFDISTTTLPKDRLHKKGGMYEKKVEDGFEVLEIPKGAWTEAIFAKLKPIEEKAKLDLDEDNLKIRDDEDDEDDDEDEDEEEERPRRFGRKKPARYVEEDDDEEDDEDDEDEDFDDEYEYDDLDEDEDCYATTCPTCEETIYFDESVLEDGEVICPNCGEKLEFDMSSLEENSDDDQE